MKFRSVSARISKLLGIVCIVLCCFFMSTPVFAVGDIKISQASWRSRLQGSGNRPIYHI